MKSNSTPWARTGLPPLLLLIAAVPLSPLSGGELLASDWKTVDVFQTNRSTRVITNVIEVRVPENVFVDEFRTNSFERTVTNVVEVPVTNWSTITLTNEVVFDQVRTNVVTTTNWLKRESTNFVRLTVTRTNLVQRYQTNSETVTLTNWTTLTNSRTAQVAPTNPFPFAATHIPEFTVQAHSRRVMAREATPVSSSVPLSLPETNETRAVSVPVPEALILDATRTSRPADNLGVEVNFKAALSNDPEAVLLVQWRVEREDRAVLLSSQAPEFTRILPPGRYQIQIRARRDASSAPILLERSLDVTRDAVIRR